MRPAPYPNSNSLLMMKDLKLMSRPFDLLGFGGYTAGNVGVGGIDYIDELLDVSM